MSVDMVNHPPHYTQGKYETIDVIEDAGWGYRLATAFKYIHRCEYKGKKKEDLRKAVWFLLREINSIEDEPSNVGQDLGYNAWTCRRCKKGTNLVDSAWVCANCRSLELEGESESFSKASEEKDKETPRGTPKDRLGGHTEALENRSIMLAKHYPDNEVHKEQLTLWNMVGYD